MKRYKVQKTYQQINQKIRDGTARICFFNVDPDSIAKSSILNHESLHLAS